MLKKLQKRNSEGFTIIEVMIVLAIAALILLIVLLAVPALQRSSRNTQRKNDVSTLSSAIGDFINNNNGTGPASDDDLKSLLKNVKLSQYDPDTQVFYQGTESSVDGITVSATGSESASNLSIDDVIVVKGATCNGNNPASGSVRSYAILYAIESKSTTNGQAQCVEAS